MDDPILSIILDRLCHALAHPLRPPFPRHINTSGYTYAFTVPANFLLSPEGRANFMLELMRAARQLQSVFPRGIDEDADVSVRIVGEREVEVWVVPK